jgi:hypothetical protein
VLLRLSAQPGALRSRPRTHRSADNNAVGQILRRAKRCFRDKEATSSVLTRKEPLPEWCTCRSVLADRTGSVGGVESARDDDKGPSSDLLRDVLAMIQEPSSICIAGEALGGGGGPGEGAAASAPPCLSPALRVWQDQLVSADGGWRRKGIAVPAADPEVRPIEGGCASFLRSRPRRQMEADDRIQAVTGRATVRIDAQAGTNGSVHNTRFVLDAVAGASAERRMLLALTGESVVVSLCIQERQREGVEGVGESGSSERRKEGDREGVEGGDASGAEQGSGSVGSKDRRVEQLAQAEEPMASVAGVDGEYDLRVRREEALWRLDEWMRFVFAR